MRRLFDLEKFGTFAKRSKQSKYVKYAGNSFELKGKKKGSSRDKGGSSLSRSDARTESTENFGLKPHQPLQIWQHNEYSVNGNDASEVQWDENDLQSVWRGGLGTKSTVVSNSRSRSDSPQ